MTKLPSIVVLHGGVGSERAVSLRSGEAVAAALAHNHTVDLLRLDEEALPLALDSGRNLVFPALHGAFGEDGRLQGLMDLAGIEYCGSGASASQLCMNKDACKQVAQRAGIDTPEWLVIDGANLPPADSIIERMGSSLVLKPTDQGSSVGLYFTEHRSALGVTLSTIHQGRWLVEQRIRGRELTVGLLNGKAMGIVEIQSASGVYDYKAKYSTGSTQYFAPADLPSAVEVQVKTQAEQLFAACGCRDFARIDFLLSGTRPFFLEINTLPGLTATSLLPKSAACEGLNFQLLASKMVEPAIDRFNRRLEHRTES